MAAPFLPQAQPVYPTNTNLAPQLTLLGDTIGQGIEGYRKQSLLGEVLKPGPDGKPPDYGSVALKLLQNNLPKEAAIVATMANQQFSQNSVYGTPIYGTNPDGSTAIGTFDKSGSFRPINTGQFTPTPGVKMLDTGTGYVPVQSRTGQPVPGQTYQPGQPAPQPGVPPPQTGYIPKDVSGEAREKVVGKEEGETRVNLEAMRGKLPGLQAVVKKLGEIGDKATYTAAGQLLDYGRTQANLPPRDEAVARTTYIAMVDNQVLPLLRETFGAQFTQKEGESLKITLGDPNKTPKEKRAVLDAFIEQKIRNVQSLENQLSKGGGSPNMPKVGEVRDGYRYKGGNPASPESWINTRLK